MEREQEAEQDLARRDRDAFFVRLRAKIVEMRDKGWTESISQVLGIKGHTNDPMLHGLWKFAGYRLSFIRPDGDKIDKTTVQMLLNERSRPTEAVARSESKPYKDNDTEDDLPF